MQNATLSPIPLLRQSFEVVGPIYSPLLILAFPSFVFPIVAGLFFSGQLLGLGLACWAIGAPILVGAAFGLVDRHLKQQSPSLGESLKQAVSRAVTLIQPVKESRGTVATLSKPTPEAGWINQ